MKQEKLQKVLEQMGLSGHEAAVYLAALSLGPSPILALARTSGVKRTTVYSVLTSLQKKGLMIREVRGWKTLFAAERPEKLEVIIESKKTDLIRALPDLSAM